MKLINRLGALFVVGAFSFALFAQTPTTPPPACTASITGPSNLSNALQALRVERAVALTDIRTTITPNLNPATLAALQAGAMEIRDLLLFNPTINTVGVTTFTVAPGSPLPTPTGVDISGSTIQSFSLAIDRIYVGCKPNESVMFTGTITQNSTVGPYGSFQGAPAAISVTLSSDNPPKISNVVELISGVGVVYSSAGMGTVTFPAAPVTPPGTSGNAPTIVINSGKGTGALLPNGLLQVVQNPFHLDASGSTDPNNLALTYKWTSSKPAQFIPNATVAAPDIQFQSGAGDYTITLTVTNSAGASSTQTITLEYTGTR